MSYTKFGAAAFAAMMVFGSAATAAGVLDQNSAPGGGKFNENLDWQQQVTAGVGGQLTGLTLYGDGTTVNVGVSPGDAFVDGPYAFSGSAHLSDAGTFVDTSGANIFLTAGQHFVIDLSGGTGGNILMALTQYGGGDLWLNFGVKSDYSAQTDGQTLAFQTFMAPPKAPVVGDGIPEPAEWALMLMGFGGLGAAIRKRRPATA